MDEEQQNSLTDAELKQLFDRLFPNGFAGPDVLAEIAPDGWEKSPLLPCFHPSPEQVYREQLQLHRNLDELANGRREDDEPSEHSEAKPAPTLDQILADWKDTPVNVQEEVVELVGKCLWDIFSDNHAVIAAGGRKADLGSFRSAGSFLHEYLTGDQGMPSIDAFLKAGDDLEKLQELMSDMGYMRFYMGSVWLRGRADLTPVYALIFRRLKALGGDWEYHFPELSVVDLRSAGESSNEPAEYSPSESFGREQEEKEREEEMEQLRADLAEDHRLAREAALDQAPPSTVLAYQSVFGRDPKGWPPA